MIRVLCVWVDGPPTPTHPLPTHPRTQAGPCSRGAARGAPRPHSSCAGADSRGTRQAAAAATAAAQSRRVAERRFPEPTDKSDSSPFFLPPRSLFSFVSLRPASTPRRLTRPPASPGPPTQHHHEKQQVYSAGALTVRDTTFARNAAPAGTGGAVLFDVANAALVADGSRFTENTAAACGAVGVLSAARVQLSNSSLVGNAAAAGDGGALCYAPPALVQTQHVCVSGQTLRLPQQTGDLSVVTPGQLIPAVELDCAWELFAPESSGCTVRSEIITIFVISVPSLFRFRVSRPSIRGIQLYPLTLSVLSCLCPLCFNTTG